MATKIKVYELAKELAQTPERVMDIGKRLGMKVKSPMSYLGSVEAQNVRDFLNKDTGKTKTVVTKTGTVTEKRVGARVIRRRAKTPAKTAPEVEEEETPQEENQQVEARPAEDQVAEKAPAKTTTVKKTGRNLTGPLVKRSKMAPPAEPKVIKKAEPKVVEAPQVEEKVVAAAPAPEKAPEKKGRRLISSIIKRTKTEEHLEKTVGSKPEKRERKQVVTPGEETTAPTSDIGRPGRVKEVTLAPVQAQKEVKRRMMQRQNSVFRSSDFLKRELVQNGRKKKQGVSRPSMSTMITTPAEHKRVVTMGETISVADLGKEMGIKSKKVLEKVLALGMEAEMDTHLDKDSVELLSGEFGFSVKQEVFREEDFIPQQEAEDAAQNLKPRAPVVTVMGHVDHGKTSLLDKIRNASVVDGEAGGITQHIGAYTVVLDGGKITFVDTPGHEAFTAMRARGAQVTDVVILVVAASEGPMPQTIESIAHAKAAGVPIVVALNKCDLPDANPEKVKQTLAGHGLTPEEWGGDTIFCNVSAKTGEGIDKLLESVLLQAELAELKADYDGPAVGTIIESRLDKGRGPVVTCLVQSGSLKVGDNLVVGETFGKARAITDFKGQRVKTAGPSDAIEIIGLQEVPGVGDPLYVLKDDKKARDLAKAREDKRRGAVAGNQGKTLEELLAAPSEAKEFRILLKGDVQGSVEAVKGTLLKIPQEKVEIKVLHSGSGGITESDVNLAAASQGVILGFNVRPDSKAKRLAEAQHVGIYCYRIIYELVDEVKKLMEGLMDAKVEEKVIGRAQVRDTFTVPKVGTIAGSAVIDGKITRGCWLRLLRDSRVIYEGKLSSLRRFKDDVKEVGLGYECGIGLENYNDIKSGDELEAYIKEEVRDTL